MAEVDVDVSPYNGSLLAANLLSGQQTLLLTSIGVPKTGTLSDVDGTLGNSDAGTSTFDGQPITYIGSGTVQPGVKVGFLTVPLGAAKDVVVFSVGGKIHFHFPDGPPNLLGAVALIVDVDPVPYHLFDPVCFAADTMIATPQGDRPVQDFRAGDEVLDCDGRVHRIRWAGGAQRQLPLALIPDAVRWLPVVIPKDAFGPGRPSHDLHVSQQHRLMIEGAAPQLLFGEGRVLLPAISLVGDRLRLDRLCRHVTYHHLLCPGHVVLMANGLPAESLLPSRAESSSAAHPSRIEAEHMFPDLPRSVVPSKAAYPVLRRSEGTLLQSVLRG